MNTSFKSNLKPLFNPLSPRIKRIGYKVGILFLNKSLVEEIISTQR